MYSIPVHGKLSLMNKFVLFDLEIDLHEQCNLKCVQCSHSSPHFTNKDPEYSLDEFTKDIQTLSKLITVSSLRIVGGEPFLNKQIVEYLRVIKQSGLAKELKVFTNGLLLNKVDSEVFSLIDSLKISLYTNLPQHKLDLIQSNIKQIKEQHPDLDVVSNEISYFLKSNLLEENLDKQQVQKIYDKCYYSYEHRGCSIFKGRLYKCFASRKKYKFLKSHNKLTDALFKKLNPSIVDSIPINDDMTIDDIEALLSTKQSLEACKWCLGTCGKIVKHEQLKDLKEDYATKEDLDFEAGEIYISNNILSWDRFNKALGNIKNNKFFNIEHLKHYIKLFKFK